MSLAAKKRLQSDLMKITKDPPPGVQGNLGGDGDNMFEWDAIIFGPGDTCFEGGTFRLKMKFPKDYPKRAPTVWFYSRMFHPNVYPNGKICLDILEMEDKWKPEYDACTVLCAIQSMLGDPNPGKLQFKGIFMNLSFKSYIYNLISSESPANGEANSLYLTNKAEYERKVRQIVYLSEEEDGGSGGTQNLNIEDVEDELVARVGELDLTGFQGDPETLRQFLTKI